MVKFHGKAGNVTWDTAGTASTLPHIQSWNCEIVGEAIEYVEMDVDGTINYKQRIAGMQDWTATVECLLDSDGSDINPATGGATAGLGQDYVGGGAAGAVPPTLSLVFSTGVSMGGYAICNGLDVGVSVDGLSTITYAFQGTGILAVE